MFHRTAWFNRLIVTLAAILILAPILPLSAYAADLTSKYRVYQGNRILMEYPDYAQALQLAKTVSYGRVENIHTKEWLWDNYPRYQIYQAGQAVADGQFQDLQSAVRAAGKLTQASIKDLQDVGWVWDNYPNFRVYQGDNTMDTWQFASLEEAAREAKKWSHSHIINLNSNAWVWDNLTQQEIDERKQRPPIYQVYKGEETNDAWSYSFLKEAVLKALTLENSRVVNTETKRPVFFNMKKYKVYQNQALLKEFVGLRDAISFAGSVQHASIVQGYNQIWNNEKYYQVHINNRQAAAFSLFKNALNYASGRSNTSIVTQDRQIIWDNFKQLQFWSWNGSSTPENIRKQAAQTLGLDIDSPTWFQLADAKGNLKDTSDPATVKWLKDQGISVHPLVHNQFDSGLTRLFLQDAKAQDRFISELIARASALGVDGLNIDFESLRAADRNAFTSFLEKLTHQAHLKSLKISVDLPRGSIRWNHQTAFDHEKLARIADYIIIMAYDQYYSGSDEPGSVSGMQWAEEGVTEFLSYGIERSKLVLGIPFYVRLWKLDQKGHLLDNRALLLKDIPDLLKQQKTKAEWDDRFNQYKVTYTEGGYQYVFWLEDKETVKKRLEIAAKYDLHGVASWRLGHEYPEIWNAMLEMK